MADRPLSPWFRQNQRPTEAKTKGLPVKPPIVQRVSALLAWTRRDGDRVVIFREFLDDHTTRSTSIVVRERASEVEISAFRYDPEKDDLHHRRSSPSHTAVS